MSKYECAVVFAPSVADDELPQQVDRVKDWLTGIGAEISELDIWGRRKLAYPIRKYLEGIYLFCYFDIPDATRLREVDRRFNNAEEVLRHLVIRLPDLKELPRVKVEEEPEAKKEEEPEAKKEEEPEAKKEEEGEAKVEGEAKKEEEGEAKVEGEAKPEGESKAEGEAKPEGESKAEGEGGEEKKETTSPAVVASTEAPVAQSASSPESGETGGETPAPAPEPEPEPTVELEESQPPAQAEASESSESEKKD